ncbi:MAG: SET domain-containing protein [Candidatus Komeilibacteria bacterium]|nr:SET domain-containing protein [Candidatus Komeilibacteria bacterium]
MIKVKTKLGISSIHGIGLFADQFIPKGTITWEYHPLFDTGFSEEEMGQMSKPARTQFLNYAYFDKELNKYILCFDDQRFINHSSKNYNIVSTPRQDTAARDIQIGEELLCDYIKYDDTWFERKKENFI